MRRAALNHLSSLSRAAVPRAIRRQARIAEELFGHPRRRRFTGQFAEDAILLRYFEQKAALDGSVDIPFKSRSLGSGFYVDVGAFMPKLVSNTYEFYKEGWRGINIDAAPGSMRLFNRLRPRDVNLEFAVSDVEGVGQLVWFGYGSSLNTLSPENAPRSVWPDHAPEGVTIQTYRLDTIFDQHLPPGQDISFLNIDVEGHDVRVLRSNDWTKYRPELVVVEQHLAALSEVFECAVYESLTSVGYTLYSWANPTLIFKEQAA